MKRNSIILFFPCLLWAIHANAQQGAVVSGGDASGSNGKVSYSIGQMDYQTETGSGGSVAQGLQQPFEISTVSGIEATGIRLTDSAYPNPTTDFVTLKISDTDVQNMSYVLMDAQGKFLAQRSFKTNHTDISMTSLHSGTYFIRVIRDKTEIKIFKIIKNN